MDIADVKDRRVVRGVDSCLRSVFCLRDLTKGSPLHGSFSGCCGIELADVGLCVLRNLAKAFIDSYQPLACNPNSSDL